MGRGRGEKEEGERVHLNIERDSIHLKSLLQPSLLSLTTSNLIVTAGCLPLRIRNGRLKSFFDGILTLPTHPATSANLIISF